MWSPWRPASRSTSPSTRCRRTASSGRRWRPRSCATSPRPPCTSSRTTRRSRRLPGGESWSPPGRSRRGSKPSPPQLSHGAPGGPAPGVTGQRRPARGAAGRRRRAATPPWTPGFSSRGPLLRSVPRARGDSQLIRLRYAPPGCYSPLDPWLFLSWPAPSERPTSQGGFAAHPAPLRSAGLLLPPGPLAFPLVARSFGASHEPGGIRSSSGSATLRRAATPPWTPGFSSRGPLLRSVPRARGDSQLIRLRYAPPGCYSPLDPWLFLSWPASSERPTSQGGFAAHPDPLRSAGLLLPPGPLAFPLVARSFGASHEPGGIRSSSGSATLRRAATPPWTPLTAFNRSFLHVVAQSCSAAQSSQTRIMYHPARRA